MVFRWLGPCPAHDSDLWKRTSGKKVSFFGRLGWDLRSENIGKSQKKCKKTMRREKCPFSDDFESMVHHIAPKKRSPCFDNVPNVSYHFSY